MQANDVAKKLVELCRHGKNLEAISSLYAKDIVSVEAHETPTMAKKMQGVEAVIEKNKWWFENHIIHSASVDGPYVNGDKFAVYFKYDVTMKSDSKRIKMDEVGVYTVADGKVTHEEFLYGI